MKPEDDAQRRRFLRDLDNLVGDLAAPFGSVERSRPRARDWVSNGLRWRLWAEPEPPAWPRTFRLTWGVNPASRPATNECMWAEDVEQLRHGSTRIYKYRLGTKPSLRQRLSDILGGPDVTLPQEEMAAHLGSLVGSTLLPLYRDHGDPDALASWVLSNHRQIGRYGDRGSEAVRPVADALRRR